MGYETLFRLEVSALKLHIEQQRQLADFNAMLDHLTDQVLTVQAVRTKYGADFVERLDAGTQKTVAFNQVIRAISPNPFVGVDIKHIVGFVVDAKRDSGIRGKYYDHEAIMKAVSNVFPDLLFVMTGLGEEADDQWKRYYLNGKMQLARAQIVFPAFNYNELK